MFASLLISKYGHIIAEGWGAYEVGNYERSEEHFQEVLNNEDDPKIGFFDLVEAHNGMGALSLAHKDFFDATRWYQESKYMLDQHFESRWPKRLDWAKKEDRPIMRTVIGLAHLYYRSSQQEKAKELYMQLLYADNHDGLGVRKYLEALDQKKKFEEVE